MDDLEKFLFESLGDVRDAESKRAEDLAIRVWRGVTNHKPAYTKVLSTKAGISKNRYLVEIDGVRISSFKTTADSLLINAWDIVEPLIQQSPLSMENLANPRVLKRRRKRLKQRGLYREHDHIDNSQ